MIDASKGRVLWRSFRPVVVVQDGEEDKEGRTCADKACPQRGTKNSSGLPQAGTLVVAPTSLLKQWQSEIETKVCSHEHVVFFKCTSNWYTWYQTYNTSTHAGACKPELQHMLVPWQGAG